LAALACSTAFAADDFEIRSSVAVVSNYLYEGVSQSWNRPALQGEIEVEHDIGVYAGAFVSTISPRQFPGGALEVESWLGYGYDLGNDSSLAVELGYFAFPGANMSNGECGGLPCASQSFNTAQVRGVAQWRWLSFQLGYSLTDYFGAATTTGFAGSTRGTTRIEASAEPELPFDGAWTLIARVGYTHYGSAFLTPVLPGVDGNGGDYTLGLKRRFVTEVGRMDVVVAVAGTSHGVTSRSLTDSAQTRLGGPLPFIGLTLSF
jgi:uncharacterized protein (TIGR02001 family)